MSFARCITELKKQEQAINDKFEALMRKLGYSDWDFCIHTHFNEPMVSMWKKGDNKNVCTSFIVKEGYGRGVTLGYMRVTGEKLKWF